MHRSRILLVDLCASCLFAPLAAQALPAPKGPVPEITNRNLDQFRPGPLAVANGASAPLPPPGTVGPALELPEDRGAHPAASRERWSLKAILRNEKGEIFPFQLTFSSRGSDGVQPGVAWSRTRFMTAQTSLGLAGERKILAEARRGRFGLAAGASADRLGLRCDGWSITDPGDGRLHLDLPLAGGRVRLTLAYRGEPLSLPRFDSEDLIRRTLRAALTAEGRLEVKGRVPIPISGRALLLQEWGPDYPTGIVGWDRTFAFLADGRALLYLGDRPLDASAPGRALFLEINAGGQPTLAHRPLAPREKRTWTSPLSRARYPVAVQIQDPRETLTFEPLRDDQEWPGDWVGGLSLWSGFGTLKNPQGALIGEAFQELAGYAHPVQGRH